jgi:hypothetical protein
MVREVEEALARQLSNGKRPVLMALGMLTALDGAFIDRSIGPMLATAAEVERNLRSGGSVRVRSILGAGRNFRTRFLASARDRLKNWLD